MYVKVSLMNFLGKLVAKLQVDSLVKTKIKLILYMVKTKL